MSSSDKKWVQVACLVGRALADPSSEKDGLDQLARRLNVAMDFVGPMPSFENATFDFYLRENRLRDLHYGIVAPFIEQVAQKLKVQAELGSPFRDLVEGKSTLTVRDRIRSLAHPRDRFTALSLGWRGPLRKSIDDTYSSIEKLPGGSVFLQAVERCVSLMREIEEEVSDSPPHFVSLRYDIAEQFTSADSSQRKYTELLSRLYAQYGLDVTPDLIKKEVVSGKFLPVLSRIDGLALVSIDRILVGCTADCYGKSPQESPHALMLKNAYKGNVPLFQRLHQKETWYDSGKFALYGRQRLPGPAVDFTKLIDPEFAGIGDEIHGTIPVTELPVLSGRTCPANFGASTRTIAEVLANAAADEDVLGYAIKFARMHEEEQGRVLLSGSPPNLLNIFNQEDVHRTAA